MVRILIYVEMRGRLGNQMFQYAFARALQEKMDSSEPLGISFYNVYKKNDEAHGWENSLRYFRVKPFIDCTSNKKLLLSKSNFIQKAVGSLYYTSLKKFEKRGIDEAKQNEISLKWQPLLNRVGLYWLRHGFYDYKDYHNKNILLSGNFESPRYFDQIRDKLLEEFTPVCDPIEKNAELYDSILNSQSVCVTVRRGDFISNPAFKQFNICSPNYFYKGMDEIKKRCPKAKFFIFSDEIEWVKKNMHFPYDVMFESGSDPVWEKLRLMYSCKHFIISNSTFSWWAQYLSRNSEKLVVSPSIWLSNGFKSDLIGDDWIKIDVNNV